jgi:hypothetical protein
MTVPSRWYLAAREEAVIGQEIRTASDAMNIARFRMVRLTPGAFI